MCPVYADISMCIDANVYVYIYIYIYVYIYIYICASDFTQSNLILGGSLINALAVLLRYSCGALPVCRRNNKIFNVHAHIEFMLLIRYLCPLYRRKHLDKKCQILS